MIAEVLDKATVMHLGLMDAGRAYVVPLNYGWLENDGHYTLYAHSAQDGRKIDLIGDGAEVALKWTVAWPIFMQTRLVDMATDSRASLVKERLFCVKQQRRNASA